MLVRETKYNKINNMNDVNWRSFEDQESWDLLKKNPYNSIIVETDITTRLSFSKYIENSASGVMLIDCEEKALKFAFIN